MELYLLTSFTSFSLLFFLGELSLQKKTDQNYLLAYIFLTGGIFFFHSFLLHSNLIYHYSFLFLSPTPFLALLGPISERYLFITFENRREPISKFYKKIIPTLIVLILMIPFYFRDLNFNRVISENGKINLEHLPIQVKVAVVLALSSLFYFYLSPLVKLLFLIKLDRLWKDPKLRIFFIISIILNLFFPILFLFSYIYNRSLAHVVVSIYAGFILCFFYLVKQRFPNFFLDLQEKVIFEKKYRKSQLANIDLEKLRTTFLHLFSVEKIYLKDDLSLGNLAEKMNISNHKLSEYLRIVEQKQFYQILAEYRVEEAKDKIRNSGKMTFLEIAYSSGFYSKSNFNQVFKQITGKTPTQYKIMSKSSDMDDNKKFVS